MRLRRVTIVVLVVLLLGALAVPGAMAKKADKMVPLRGSFEGVGFEFSGNFSHLGLFDGLFGAPTVWTAANGDTVDNVTTLFEIDTDNPVAPGVFPYEQEIDITGGTGRFVCADGDASITGTVEVVSFIPFVIGEYDGDLEGTITQPNKKAVC